MSENKKFNETIKELASRWGVTPETVEDLTVVGVPFRGQTYQLCFSTLDDDFALIVMQAIENVSSLKTEALREILKSNSMLNSSLSVFFIHDNKASTDNSPLLYQALYPYSQFSIPESVSYVESYLEQYIESMERIKNKIKGARNRQERNEGGAKAEPPIISREFTGLKI